MTDTVVASTTLTVNCATPVAKRTITLNAHSNPSYGSVWACTLTNRTPQLEISLVWTCSNGHQATMQPYGIKSLRIISRDGDIVYSAPVNGVVFSTPLTASVSMASVQVKQRLDFHIVFSTCPSVAGPWKPRDVVKTFTPSLLKDIATMNMAFTFGFSGAACNVALWAHQSILSQQPSLAALMSKLPDVERGPSSPECVSGVKTTHVTEYSFEAYCALVRYLYTSEISIEIDLNDFAIGCPPVKPLSASCKKLPSVDGLFAPAALPSSSKVPVWDLKRKTTWHELFAVANCYDVKDLRKYCRDSIVNSITDENVLQILFDFAYKYDDLKETLLDFVAKNMDKLFGQDKDPFEVYKDHPERYALLVKALQLKFKNLA
ncbi:hypothetical protein BGZ93_000570 [Podila epicladia]|nr:hypothetical protein BGZ92_002270 [Podila epicladia]KAG0100482.1 hypothetical protein BGZ93_000570 [Podila epicladia]